MLKEGEKAPSFNLPADGGKNVSLNKLKGNIVILYFYPKDDTSGCTKEAIEFSSLSKKFQKIGADILGISPDSATKHDKFKKKHELTVTLLADEDNQVSYDYGVWVEKKMYGRTFMGVERSTFLIDTKGKIARIWRKVKVPGHAEQVLEAAQDLADETKR